MLLDEIELVVRIMIPYALCIKYVHTIYYAHALSLSVSGREEVEREEVCGWHCLPKWLHSTFRVDVI